jgi:hypothetical protein
VLDQKSLQSPYAIQTLLEGRLGLLPHLISEEKHDCAGVIKLIHCIEVWNLGDIYQVNDCIDKEHIMLEQMIHVVSALRILGSSRQLRRNVWVERDASMLH